MAMPGLMPRNSKARKTKSSFGPDVPLESFILIFVASFAIGFIVSLITWLFTVDYIFVILK